MSQIVSTFNLDVSQCTISLKMPGTKKSTFVIITKVSGGKETIFHASYQHNEWDVSPILKETIVLPWK